VSAPEEARVHGARSPALDRFVDNRAAVAASVLMVVLVGACLLGPPLSPYDPNEVDLAVSAQSPSLAHPFGTDLLGRDLATRMADGGRVSLLVGLAAISAILVIGFLYGSIAGYAGGRVDEVLMRVLDGLFAVPRLPVLVILLVVVGTAGSIGTLIVSLAVLGWMTTARLVRGQVRSIASADYVRAARAVGARPTHVVLRHLLPNSIGVLLVALFLELPGVILAESFVSVLGLGLAPPQASWGGIAQEGLERGETIILLLPSIAIAVFAVLANLIADGLQDALDPRRAAAPARRPLRRLLSRRDQVSVMAPVTGGPQGVRRR
jgi:oligopeptide transport system permease protein